MYTIQIVYNIYSIYLCEHLLYERYGRRRLGLAHDLGVRGGQLAEYNTTHIYAYIVHVYKNTCMYIKVVVCISRYNLTYVYTVYHAYNSIIYIRVINIYNIYIPT